MSLQQCMGGWCGQRDKCRHYTAPATPGQQPAERLCGDDAEPTLREAPAQHWAGMKPLAVPLSEGQAL